ncbi:MAG TPA: hypothetical protein VH234_04075, partial [Candidatus Saccharimonadales bacterium]|nr:hypothetical protein [Candidatus Saccharimonadales bacterium]
MQRVSGGYTILEVTIFLAISVALLGSIVALLNGRQAQVEFDQKMHDTQSKMQSWLNDVSNGFPGGDPSQLKCALNGGGRPVVTVGSPNSSPDCVFLGKALQFSDTPGQNDTISAYSIFGRRLNSSNQLPTNLTDANPEPAVGPAG